MSVTDDEVTEAMRFVKKTHNLSKEQALHRLPLHCATRRPLRMVSQLGWLSRVVMFHLRCLSRR